MLPPQLPGLRQRSLSTGSLEIVRASTSSILRGGAAAAYQQSRSFWGWRRPDYCSHIDPMFYRFTRYRTMKTRAKLFDKLRRKGRWNWDVDQKPFFSPKQIRLAHHIGRPRWKHEQESDKKNTNEATGEDEYELSKREKEWKDQMEAMRKRIEQDPYEAVFGKRFEPFWSPLVPSWMREEMGLSGWPKPKETAKESESTAQPTAKPMPKVARAPSPKPVNPTQPEQSKKDAGNEAECPNGQLTTYSYSSKRDITEPDAESPNGQLTNYSYSASTKWDSWTKKAQREEWDSVSGETRRYEYDPITNRMVEIDAYKPIDSTVRQIDLTSEKSRILSKPRQESILRPSSEQSRDNKVADSATKTISVDIPVKTSGESRKAITVPTHTNGTSPTKTSVYFPSLINTSVVPKSQKTSAVATTRKSELDLLTAADVRARVGKAKQECVAETREQERSYRHGKLDLKRSPWDQAETRVMLEQELDSLQSAPWSKDRDGKIAENRKQLKRLDAAEAQLATGRSADAFVFDKANDSAPLQTALARKDALSRSALDRTQNSPDQRALQSSIERMQTKELPVVEEVDDSAAHESTGDRIDYQRMNLPRDWAKQADLLQANRVKRTRGIDPDQQDDLSHELNKRNAAKAAIDDAIKARKSGARWVDIMNAKRAAWQAEQAEKAAAIEARDADKNAKLAKANAMLESEVKEQKFRMQEHENRYAHKISALRKELDTAYKQSSVQGDMHVERIRNLEQELERAQKAAGETSKVEKFQTERQRYEQKIRELRSELDKAFKQSTVAAEEHVQRIKQLEAALEKALSNRTDTLQVERQRYADKLKASRAELDRAFKQSSVQGEKHVERIRELEKELAAARNSTAAKPVEATQAEGDFSANVTKYAKDNGRWYKQPLFRPEATGKPTLQEIDKAVQQQKDRELVREVRDIYEKRYGTIDVHHRQSTAQKTKLQPISAKQAPQVVEVESNVDLGKALADYEQEQRYGYRKDNLEAEIAAQEKEAHDAQALMQPESSGKMRSVIASNLGVDQDVHGARIVDGTSPQVIPNEIATRNQQDIQDKWAIQWEEPPVYKVLAYDSGNDIISTATTSSNFTGTETPISIPEALSQLYQPARFVPHFAELQREGYQVIYGTKDLLVFKKVRTATNTAPSLEDHGLVKSAADSVSPPKQAQNSTINPVDGTTSSVESVTGSSPAWNSSTAGTDLTLKSPHEGYSQPADENLNEELNKYETKHYPRVKREERVFSGLRLQQSKRDRKRHPHEPSQEQVKEYKRKWKSYRSRMRWALGVGLGASVVAYGLGAAVERKERRDRERWEQILEGNRSRWW